MIDDKMMEIYRTLHASQDKYTYFFLAATITAIGFTITQTQNLALSWTQIPVGIGLVCWGLSVYFGSLNRRYYNSSLYANFGLLKVKTGQHPDIGEDPLFIHAAAEGIKEAMSQNSKKATQFGHLQTKLFILGSVCYITWHIIEMYLHT